MTTTYVASDLNRDVSERGDAVAAGQPQLVGCPVPTGPGMDVIIHQRIIEAVARRVSTACTWERRWGERGAKPGCALLVSARSQRPARGRARAWGHQWTFSPGRPRRRSPADRSSQLGAPAASGCLMSDDLAAKQSRSKSRPARDKLDFLACDRLSNDDRPVGGRGRPIIPSIIFAHGCARDRCTRGAACTQGARHVRARRGPPAAGRPRAELVAHAAHLIATSLARTRTLH